MTSPSEDPGRSYHAVLQELPSIRHARFHIQILRSVNICLILVLPSI